MARPKKDALAEKTPAEELKNDQEIVIEETEAEIEKEADVDKVPEESEKEPDKPEVPEVKLENTPCEKCSISYDSASCKSCIVYKRLKK